MKKYNPLFTPNRNGLVRIATTEDFEKKFKDFDNSILNTPDGYSQILTLYANMLSKTISENLDIKISPYVRSHVHLDETGLLQNGSFYMHFIRNKVFWPKSEGHCIVTADIQIENNIMTSNRVAFDSYEQIFDNIKNESMESKFCDPFYNAVQSVSDSFADKVNIQFHHVYYIYGHPNPMSMGPCPMSYKLNYWSKNSK